MRKALAAIIKVIAKSLAIFFSVLFVLITILILPLFNIESTLLNAGTYKRALIESGVYEQLPAMAGEEMETMKTFLANPCVDNPLGCVIEDASPELQTCLINSLGDADYEAIGTRQRNPTEVELVNSQTCLDQFGIGELTGGTQDMIGIGSEGMKFIDTLTAADWQPMLTLLLPPEETRVMVENTLDQVSAYINGETDTARVSLVALKAHLLSPAGEDLILLLLNTRPPCTDEQLAQILAGDAGGTGEPSFCAPPPQDLALLTSQLQEQLDSVAAGIPDEVTLIKPLSEPVSLGAIGPLGNNPIATVNTIRMEIRFSPLLPLGLLILITLFSIRSLKGWLRWWGIPFFVSGLILTAFGISILPTLDWAWVNFILPQFPSTLSTNITSLLHSLANSVVRALSTRIILEAAILGLLGLMAFVGSFFIKTKLKKSVPLVSTPESKNIA